MHPRLRRQLAALRTDLPPAFRQLIEKVDAAYKEMDAERAELEQSLASMTALLHRAQTRAGGNRELQQHRKEKARKAQRRLQRLLEKSRLAVVQLSPDLVVRSANGAAGKLCGAPEEDLPGKRILDVLEPIGGSELAEKWGASLRKGEPVARTLACTARDGRSLACDWVLLPRRRRDGTVFRITLILRDQTEVVEKHDAVREREERLSVALSGTSDVLWDWDLRGNRLYLSPRWRDLAGATAAASGNPGDWLDRVHPEDAAPLRAALSAHFDGHTETFEHEHRVRRADGEWRWVLVRGSAQRDDKGTAIRAAGLMSDITRHRTLVERMAHDARHDALTGLPNRTLFMDLLRHSFGRTRRHEDYRFAVLFIDIDRFKMVNDAFGHEAGDQLLQQIGRRLESCLREGDTLARLGGDEFGVLLENCAPDNALRIADGLRQTVMECHFAWETRSFNIGVSIGLVNIEDGLFTLTDVLSAADSACYMAKDKGRNRVQVYHAGDTELSTRQGEMEWIGRLQKALEEDRFVLYAQDIVGLDPARKLGDHREILIRMLDERGEIVPPMAFIPAAERYNLMPAIDRWVIRNAFAIIARQQSDKVHGPGVFAINLSGSSIGDERFLDYVREQLGQFAVSPQSICFEITETAAIARLDKATYFINQLKSMGCLFSLDDFGAGMSSFAYLKHLPVDFLKIDGGFVKDMADDLIDRAMVEAINSVGHVMGKQTIAEFVDGERVIRLLREMGVDYAQGYGIAKPRPFGPRLRVAASG